MNAINDLIEMINADEDMIASLRKELAAERSHRADASDYMLTINDRVYTAITTRTWTVESVRRCCIDHAFYDSGDNRNYDNMLTYVKGHKNPTDHDILYVALDIYNHSDLAFAFTDEEFTLSYVYNKLAEDAIIYDHKVRII